ncbi:COP9 signalosome complex subunit 3 [Escovopsis weberi]|uniref:COP9 signalosome complex subunit 3 n=1 Tax=Escovopsis weberi TaxID=150374 RepID=A0A0M8N586_ESCWE|nr:COP9 signalosome complex subunit 3 [Escovopsis weberi]
MDSLFAAVDSFKPSQRGYEDPAEFNQAAKTYLATIDKLPHNVWQAISHDPGQFLRGLNPKENSIGYCFSLHYLLRFLPADTVPDDVLAGGLVELLSNFDRQQIRIVLPQFKELLEAITKRPLLPPSVTVELIAHVIRRAEPNRSVFTSAHILLAKLAYDNELDHLAQDILDADIIFFAKPPRSFKPKTPYPQDEDQDADAPSTTLLDDVTPAAVLEYHYIRALTLIQRRDWAKAQIALEQVITHPAKDKTVSMFMTEAHKKWLLVGLLATGQVPAMPSQVGSHAKGVLNLTSLPYAQVAGLFSTDGAAELKAAAEQHAQVWETDDNGPLVLAVLAAYQEWQIINLRRVYHQVSIPQIRQTTLSAETAPALRGDEDVAALVGRMIASGMLRGELEVGPTGEQSYLRFHDECEAMSEEDFARAIAQCHRRVDALSKQYRVTSQRFSTKHEYVRYLLRQQKALERDVDAGVGFDSTIEDEDLMTGVMSHI